MEEKVWTADKPNRHGGVEITGEDEKAIALVFSTEYDDGDDPLPPTATVNLFLASRDLLAACEAVEAHLLTTFPPYPSGEGPYDKVRAAIAKARGVQQ